MNTLKDKYLLTTFIFSTLLLSVGGLNKAYAADLEVYCDDNADGDQCDIKGTPTLFNEKSWYPGKTESKTISVKNDDQNDDCDLEMRLSNLNETPNFTSKLFVALEKDNSVFYGNLSGGKATNDKTLNDLFVSDTGFGKVDKKGGTGNYTWTITFDTNAGNDFQNAQTTFDFQLLFECDHKTSKSSSSGGSRSSRGNTTTTTLAGTVSGFLTSLFTPEETKEVAGVQTENTEEIIPPVEQKEVEGVSTCSNPWWWLVFILQIFVQYIVFLYVNKKHKIIYILELIFGAVFAVIFSKFFCSWWYILVSVVISLSWILALYNRFKTLKRN